MLLDKSRAWAQVNLNSFKHNINEILKLTNNKSKIIAIVKANAYGHGVHAVVSELVKQGVDFFAVSSIDEAFEIYANGVNENILILGYTPEKHFHYLVEGHFIQAVFSSEYANKLNYYAKKCNTTIRTHVKIDTGMSRIGFSYVDNDKQYEEISNVFKLENIKVEGIFSHLCVADDNTNEENIKFTLKQKSNFDELLNKLKEDNYDYGITHLQNSYGIINYPDWNYDYIRPGLILYGVEAGQGQVANNTLELIPSFSLLASVSMVKTIKENRSVSYGRNYISDKVSKIATLSIGYGDGYPRDISNTGAYVLYNGIKCPILGNVCMDQMMIDVSEVEDICEGSIVVLIGKSNSEEIKADLITEKIDSINNDIFTRISSRIPRFYK